MAVIVSIVKVFNKGDRKEVIADVTFDNSYPTGGEPLTGADLGLEIELNAVENVSVFTGAAFSPGKSVAYDHVAKKLALTSAGVEATNASDQSTVKARVAATGKGRAARP